MPRNARLDFGSVIVIILTLVLFVGALFAKGLSEELLLEAGVFLVSVKLIMMAYRHDVTSRELLDRMQQLQGTVARLEAEVGRSGEGRSETAPETTPG